MKTLRVYFEASILSFEFLILTVGTVALFFPNYIIQVSSILSDTPEVVKHFALLPTGMAMWTLRENKKLLFPGEKKNKILQEWTDYWKLKIYFKISSAYAIIFAVMGVSVWSLGLKLTEPNGFILIITSLLGASVVVASTYCANIQQEEILLALDKP